MANLAETQQQLLAYLQSKASTIEQLVVGKNTQEVERRLTIYKEAYQLRLQENLSKQFPVLRAHLQQDAFSQLCLGYLAAYPPQHFALRDYGKHLPQFLRETLTDPNQAYLSQLAQLEWHLAEIVDASPAEPALTPADMATIQPEALASTGFQLQAHWRLQSFDYDLPPWRDHAQKHPKKLAAPARLAEAKTYALWRKGYQPYYRALTPIESQLAQALPQGVSFADLCQIASEHTPAEQAAAVVAQNLLTWIQDGWFTQTLIHS